MTKTEGEYKELGTYYSVGCFGPFPINFYARGALFFYAGAEYDECGPFSSLEAALENADGDFGGSDGGFHSSLEDAEKHAEWMRAQGYSIE